MAIISTVVDAIVAFFGAIFAALPSESAQLLLAFFFLYLMLQSLIDLIAVEIEAKTKPVMPSEGYFPGLSWRQKKLLNARSKFRSEFCWFAFAALIWYF